MRVNAPRSCEQEKTKSKYANNHPTVKPIALMEYLVKMVAPENAIVLDPFMGSGTTGVAAVNLGRGFVGIEKEKEYFDIAERRIENAEKKDKTNEEPTGKDGEAE
jgi:site-specific DNA-methyltransferase (adenine-specific)